MKYIVPLKLSCLSLLAVISSVMYSAPAQPFYSEQVDTVSGITPATRAAVEKIAGGGEKIGLVLSGGGAKGIAHIGVIKALEDNDIPIDCLAGTSMGAVVGSLYACGYTPEKMMELITSEVFLNCSTGTIDPDLTYYFSQPTPTPEWASVNLSLNLNKDGNITDQIIPSSLINPLPMNIEFLNLFTPYTKQIGGDFNNLFVPFRCVCSDVYNKHKVVLHSGSLGNAVRASMSFPTVFRPIEINGLLMYDGGIYDNFPVDVMQQDFEPDFIIGVSVSGPDGKPEPGNLMDQLEDMIIQNNNYSVPSENGVKIQVPVLNFGVLDFTAAKTIYDIGYNTGLSMVDSIKSRISARRGLDEVNRRRDLFAAATPEILFDSVSVTGARPGQARYLKFLFTNGLENRPFGLEQTQASFYRAISGGKLSNLLPFALINEPVAGKNTLLLQADVKNPWSVGVGGWITSTTQSMLYLRLGFHTLSYNSLDVDLSGWIGQSYYAGMLDGKFTIHTRRPSYMKLEGVMSRYKFYNSQIMFYQETTPSFVSEIENYAKIKYCVATGLKSIATASFGYAYRSDRFMADYAGSDLSRRDMNRYHDLALQLEWEFNTLSHPQYPMSGRRVFFNLAGQRIESNFIPNGDISDQTGYEPHYKGSLAAKWEEYFPVHKHFVLGAMAEGLMTLQGLYGTYMSDKIREAAFAPTPSTRNYFNPAFRNDNYIAIGFLPIWNPMSKLQLRGSFFGYQPIRRVVEDESVYGRKWSGRLQYDGWLKGTQFIGEVAAVYNFPFASLSVYGNYLSNPRKNWNFGISFGLYFQAPRFIR
ncbi:MAG: patatin-like phospholipase family protein [Muribaculaceae bacterium]|nr:patatin-like phospholipase family protein [Muribaculaceae bacterium]